MSESIRIRYQTRRRSLPGPQQCPALAALAMRGGLPLRDAGRLRLRIPARRSVPGIRPWGDACLASQLQALTGDVQDTTLQDLAGKVAVINFWGTWCPPCREEFPEITAFWVQMRDEPDFRFLSVSCGDQDTELGPLRMETIMFLVQKESKLPTYADQGPRRAVMSRWPWARRASPIRRPSSLDQTGVIRGVWIGYDPGIGDKLKALVSELLKKKS